jgi:hypothetical protein
MQRSLAKQFLCLQLYLWIVAFLRLLLNSRELRHYIKNMPNSYRDVYCLIPGTVPGSYTGEIVVTNPLHQDVALPPAPDCTNDAAIAAALHHTEDPDTNYDEYLARQCYEEELQAMCMQQRGGPSFCP